jgi:hypothetical protein
LGLTLFVSVVLSAEANQILTLWDARAMDVTTLVTIWQYALQFVKSLAGDAGFHAPKGDVCLRGSAPGVTGFRADGIILLADEDCSKDLLIDTFGCDPTLVTSLAASSDILFDNVFAADITTKNAKHQPQLCYLHNYWIHCVWLFQQGTLRFDRPIHYNYLRTRARFFLLPLNLSSITTPKPLVHNVFINVCCFRY